MDYYFRIYGPVTTVIVQIVPTAEQGMQVHDEKPTYSESHRVFSEGMCLRKQKHQDHPLTSGATVAGFPTSLGGEATCAGPHRGCLGTSARSLFSGPGSSGKSNLVNSNSDLEAGPLFSRTLDFRSVLL